MSPQAPAQKLPRSIEIVLRRPAQIAVHALLARALLVEGKPRGLRRLGYKMARGLFHLVHQRLGWPAWATLTPTGGTPFTVDCANTGFLDYARRGVAADGIEPETCALLAHLAPRLAVVYDIGANWGFYPLLLGGDANFTGEIHAFEIHPKTAADLRRVVASSGLSRRVAVHDFGLSDRDGATALEITRHSYLARIAENGAGRATEPVAVRRLDALDLPSPQLIKLDVEGHEAAVIRGGAGLIAGHRPLVVFESWYRPEQPDRMREPLELLARLGYAFCRLVWHPAGDGRGRVELLPMAPEARAEFAEALNLLAYDPSRAGEFGL